MLIQSCITILLSVIDYHSVFNINISYKFFLHWEWNHARYFIHLGISESRCLLSFPDVRVCTYIRKYVYVYSCARVFACCVVAMSCL